MVERTLNLHAYSLRKNNITVDFLKEAGMPYALGDPHQLMQVFLNLIVNAEQAIREARDKGTLRIRLGKGDKTVWVSFHDDGPGIPKENLASIFDPFYTTKRPGRGTGLGLSICKSVMKEHNGSVEAANAPDGGAVFTVTLPVRAAERSTRFETFCESLAGLGVGEIGRRLLALHGHRDGIPSAQAERGDAALHVAADHFVDQRDQHARAAGADGMADGHRAAVHIDFVRIQPEFAHHAERLHRERFVQFVEIDVFILPASLLPDLCGPRRREPS